MKDRHLGQHFHIHPFTVSRIIIKWANFLYTQLETVTILMSSEELKANLLELRLHLQQIQSGIQHHLTEDMAVMANKGFLIDYLVPGKVYCPPFLLKQSQMPTAEVRSPEDPFEGKETYRLY
ncbi:unnamed protein product [Coregonus sp. 'balchen']|nr:unnamed protein product [Coregonus sp. 'balchen']